MEGITNPFEVNFKPLIEYMKDKKGELERRVGVANHECMFEIVRFL